MSNFESFAARVPLRISFAGGGTDVEPYVTDFGGLILSATIKMYVHVDIWRTEEPGIKIASLDTGDSQILNTKNFQKLLKSSLIANCLSERDLLNLDGLGISVRSPVPPGSGLGASSAIAVAVIGVLNEWKGEKSTPEELAKSAYIVERQKLGISGGYQDQYSCAVGGFNFIEFGKDFEIKIDKLNISNSFVKEMEHNLILLWTGGTRRSDLIIDEQIEGYKRGTIIDLLHAQKELAFRMKLAFERSDLNEVGQLLNHSWKIKRQYTSKISNQFIDEIYKKALEEGALGGKILGAGGGGFLLLLANRMNRHRIVKSMKELGLMEYPVIFEKKGFDSWKI